MFGGKTCWKQNIFLLAVVEDFAVLNHHHRRELLFSSHWSLTQCSDSSARCQLCSSTEGKPQLPLWNYTASQNHTISRGQHSVMKLAAPLASEQGGTCWLLYLLGLPWPSEPSRTCCSQQGEGTSSLRHLSHCNLVSVHVREEGLTFFPLPPAIYKEWRGGSYLKSWGTNCTENKSWKWWENNDEKYKRMVQKSLGLLNPCGLWWQEGPGLT